MTTDNSSGTPIFVKETAQKILDCLIQPRFELLETLSKKISLGEHVEGFCILEDAYEKGAFLLPQAEGLLSKIGELSTQNLSDRNLKKLIKIKFALASKQGNILSLEQDALLFLRKFDRVADKKLYDGILLARANIAAQTGKKELAYSVYKSILKHEEVDKSVSSWVHRGLAITLNCKDPESYNHHRLAADAFLHAGYRREAAKSLYSMARFHEDRDLDAAFTLISEADELLSLDDFRHKPLVAASHCMKSRMNYQLGNYELALAEARASIKILTNVRGAEDELHASLTLAANACECLNLGNSLEEIVSHQSRVRPFLRDPHYRLTIYFTEAVNSNDFKLLSSLYEEIENSSSLTVAFHLLDASNNPLLKVEEKLEKIDLVMSILKQEVLPTDVCSVTCFTAGIVFLECDLEDRALHWFEKAIEYDSLNFVAIQEFVEILRKYERWEELSLFFEKEVGRFGDSHNLLFLYGEALLNSGESGKAAVILAKSRKLAENLGSSDISRIDSCLFQALSDAEDFSCELQHLPRKRVDRKLFETCLSDFKDFVQSEQRMTFWEAQKNETKKWVGSPEKHSKSLFYSFLRGRFSDDIRIFEELKTGAGRIDIFIELADTLSTVVELKMCGSGYSTNYALEGLEQLIHYLDNKGTSLGYLIVFDSRKRDFGKRIPGILSKGNKTIFTFCIDVRPWVKLAS